MLTLKTNLPAMFRLLGFACLWAVFPAFAFAQGPAVTDAEVIESKEPMQFTAVGGGVSGQLVVAPELVGTETGGSLVYTITVAPAFGRVGLAGGDEDFFSNKTGRSSYFAYQPNEDYVGADSFTYTVRNEDSGIIFRNKVVIEVKPPAPVELEKFVVTGPRERAMAEHPVVLTTRPNTALTQKVPSHEDFMKEADRASITNAKVAYALDENTKPQHGTAQVDRMQVNNSVIDFKE